MKLSVLISVSQQLALWASHTYSVNMDASPLGEPPPEYTVRDELPPDYSATSKFTIAGEVFRTPLVQISHLKAHLNFLRAIHDLKDVIEAGQDARIPLEAQKLEASQRWAWFVGLAVER